MLTVFQNPAELQGTLLQLKKRGTRIALVPTMGNLHAGHLSLIRTACENADLVCVSIFVNPTQFGPNEDYAAYPRTFEADKAKIESVVTKECYIFCPTPDLLYAPDFSTWVLEDTLSKELCGRSRPIHFRGVTTVVTKLFNITQPDVAIFGQKDAQQSIIIQRMVRDLNMPVHIIVNPIVRESDGLAMSSRNQYLSAEYRTIAPKIYQTLQSAAEKIQATPSVSSAVIIAEITASLNRLGGEVDYVEARNAENLLPVADFKQRTLIAVAYRLGTTRLIDNIVTEV